MNEPKSAPTFEQLPDAAFIRARNLMSILPFSAATLWRRCREGIFPAPVRLSAGITAWRVADIRRWLANPADFKAHKYTPTGGQRLEQRAAAKPRIPDIGGRP